MKATTQRFRDALLASRTIATTFTCTPPGGDPVDLEWADLSVSFTGSLGIRRTAAARLRPKLGADLFSTVVTPGAIFHIEHGIDYGNGNTELVPVFHGEASAGGVNIFAGEITLQLSDLWQRVERCRFTAPYAPTAGTRSTRIIAAVVAAIPGIVSSDDTDGGGTFTGGKTWDRDRTQFIRDMASDGELDPYFDADGTFHVRDLPVLTPTAPDYTFRTGDYSNIEDAERARPLDRLYNKVIVIPSVDTQTWAPQSATISDPDHPRHPDKIGVVPFWYASPTITSTSKAANVAYAILQRVQGTTETLRLGVFSNPALEDGDTVAVVHEATETNPSFSAVQLIDSGQLDCATGQMTVTTRSSVLAEIEEAA